MKKIFKKLLAVALSITMTASMPMIAFASGISIDVTNLGSSEYDVTNVVVPVSYAVAFNPDGLEVYKDSYATVAVTSQVVSRNFGIINKSNKDKIVTVRLTVMDEDGIINFVDSLDGHTGVDDYAIRLVLKPSDGSKIQVVSGGGGVVDIDVDTSGSALGNIVMTESNTEIVMKNGNNYVSFKLGKAEFPAITLNGQGKPSDYTATAISEDGTAGFTFSGEMNTNADWSKLKNGVKIVVRYSWKTATDKETVVPGTNMVVDTSPAFTGGNDVGVINITAAADGNTVESLAKITAPWKGTDSDITSYATLSDDKTKITISKNVLTSWAADNINPVTVTIKYYDSDGQEKSIEVPVKTQ